jgi:hypothetical protein
VPHLARRPYVKLLPIVVATALAACALGAPSDALAGNNGQQIKACPTATVSNGFFWINGPNQNGDRISSPVFALGAAGGMNEPNAGCVTVSNYWWSGWVDIFWYRSDGRLYGKFQCWVPQWNPLTNVRRCEPV